MKITVVFSNNIKMIRVVVYILVLISAIYLGTGGFLILENDQKYENSTALEKELVTYKNVTYDNKEAMKAAIQQGHILKIYPYILNIPSQLNFIIAAISFGIIGASGKVINDTIKTKTKLSEINNLLLISLQGAVIGLIILGISYTIPFVLTSENVTLRPITVLFLSLFGGIFYLNFYDWIEKIIKRNIYK